MPVDVDKAVISRLTFSGKKFEILVDPNKALQLKSGEKVNMEDILAYPVIYKDVGSTDQVPKEDLQKVFGTTDVYKIAEKIIKDGELQLTTEQRRRMVEQKKNQIAEIISKRGINPQTNVPHPPQRILNVMEQRGVNVDPFVNAEMQVDNVLKNIKSIIPIKFQKVMLEIKIPPQHAGRTYSILKSMGTLMQEQWLNDGSLKVNIELLAGLQDDLFKKLSDITHGDFESKLVKRVDL